MASPKESGWRYVQWARTQTVGDASAKAVLNALATYADWRTGKCIVGQETLATHTEKGVSTVRAGLRKLEKLKLISRRGRGEQGKRLADEITLTPGLDNPLPLDASASGPSTTASFQATTARNGASLPPRSGGVTLHSEHTSSNTPFGGAPLDDFGGMGSTLLLFPEAKHVHQAADLLKEFNLYDGSIQVGDMADQFVAHAEKSGRQIRNVDGAWRAWVKKRIEQERDRLGVNRHLSSPSRGHQ